MKQKILHAPYFLDVLIVNQTAETLQNLTVEFATLGDLKLVDRPVTHNLAPHSFLTVKAPIKVSSTETGVIFGNIVYDSQTANENSSVVVLNDIHIDIMDYINPAYCTETQVRDTGIVKKKAIFDTSIVPQHVDRVRVGEQGERQHQHHVSILLFAFLGSEADEIIYPAT